MDENGNELTILGLAMMRRKEQTKVALPRSSSREVTFNIINPACHLWPSREPVLIHIYDLIVG